MTRSGKKFAAILAVAILGAAAILAVGHRELSSKIASVVTPEPLHVKVATSITKQKWLSEAAASFNARGDKTAAGQPVVIDITGVLSGDSMLAIEEGRLKPAAWSPGEQNWVSELNDTWMVKNNHNIASAACKPTAYAPLGIAIWQPMARALGWPDKKISWKMLIDLAADPSGWTRYGHPEWGRLKLGYSHPQYSSAGLLFLTSAIHAVAGKTGALEPGDIYQPDVESALGKLAQNTTKYGLSSADLLNLMARNGPQFLHAASAFEQAVVQLNIDRGKDLRWPMAFVFPEEGTYWSDHPYCVLDNAPWVTLEQAEAARRFGDYLLKPEQQAIAAANYVRPINPQLPIGNPLSIANGTDPSIREDAKNALAIPGPEESKAVIDMFLTTKRKSTVLVVLDVSGSMLGNPIRSATEATRQFLGRLSPQDRVGLVTFNDVITTAGEIAPVSKVGEVLANRVVNLVADGGTNLNGAVCQGIEMLKAEQKKDSAGGENRLYGMVLLSDGADTTGQVSEGRMFQTCLPTGAEEGGIRVFTIAFGDKANTDLLQRIARASEGASFAADAQSIEASYLKISAEQ